MKPIISALTALFLMTGPTFADVMILDLPRLTFPDDSTATVTKGCSDPTVVGTATVCQPGK